MFGLATIIESYSKQTNIQFEASLSRIDLEKKKNFFGQNYWEVYVDGYKSKVIIFKDAAKAFYSLDN